MYFEEIHAPPCAPRKMAEESEVIMKKYLSAALALVLAVSFASCDPTQGEQSEITNENSSVSETVSTVSEVSEPDADKERIAELEAELAKKTARIEELQAEINKAREDYGKLADELNTALEEKTAVEKQLSDLKSSAANAVKSRGIYNSNYRASFQWHYSNGKTWFTLSYIGEEPVIITEDQPLSITYLALSPNIKQVVYNDYEWEAYSNVYLCDIEKKTTRKLDLSELPPQRTVTTMEWLDDRYFMFVIQFDQGTIAVGGDLYVYDTQTDKYQPIVVNSNGAFQTHGVESYEKLFVVKSSLYDDEDYFTTEKYHTLTADEIYDLIKNNKTVDLSKTKALND